MVNFWGNVRTVWDRDCYRFVGRCDVFWDTRGGQSRAKYCREVIKSAVQDIVHISFMIEKDSEDVRNVKERVTLVFVMIYVRSSQILLRILRLTYGFEHL